MEEAPKQNEALLEELGNLRIEAYRKDKEEDNFSFHDKVLEKSKELKQRYSNYSDYELYHLLIGSQIKSYKEFDFPGDDSVEKFLRSL